MLVPKVSVLDRVDCRGRGRGSKFPAFSFSWLLLLFLGFLPSALLRDFPLFLPLPTLLELPLACEQVLHLWESREVTRVQHAKGDTSFASRFISHLPPFPLPPPVPLPTYSPEFRLPCPPPLRDNGLIQQA